MVSVASLIANPLVRWLAVVGTALTIGYIKGCADESTKRVALEKRIDAEKVLRERQLAMDAVLRNKITDRREAEHENAIADLTGKLRAAIAAAGVPAVPQGPALNNCPDAQADVAGRLARLEAGVLARLVGPGNEAIVRTMTCREWVIDQGLVPAPGGPQ